MNEKDIDSVTVLDNITPIIEGGNETITVSGKVFDFKVSDDNSYATFRLNYDKDFAINIYIDSYNWKKLLNVGVKLKEKDYVKVSGYPDLWKQKDKNNKFILQIKARTIYHNEEKTNYYCPPNNKPKALPENPKITLISNVSGAGAQDFLRILSRNKNIDITKVNVPMEGDKALEEIPAVIKAANDSNHANLICIVRGGGDTIGIRYIFDNEKICQSITNSKKPVLIGVGHTKDFTNADRASDAPFNKNGSHNYFITPTDLANYINKHYYKSIKQSASTSTDTTIASTSYNKYLIVAIVILLLYIFFVK